VFTQGNTRWYWVRVKIRYKQGRPLSPELTIFEDGGGRISHNPLARKKGGPGERGSNDLRLNSKRPQARSRGGPVGRDCQDGEKTLNRKLRLNNVGESGGAAALRMDLIGKSSKESKEGPITI